MASPIDRIESAIRAARAVRDSPAAAELRRTSKGTCGTWDPDDEARLRDGWVRVWSPNSKRNERINVNAAALPEAYSAAQSALLARVRATAELLRGGG